MGNLEMSDFSSSEALNIKPNSPFALHMKGLIFYDRLDYTRAEECFRDALKEEPNDTAIYTSLAAIYIKKRKTDEALELVNRGLAINPNNQALRNHLFQIYSIRNKPSEANKILKENLNINPENITTICNLASQFYDKENYKKSTEIYRSVLLLSPENELARRGFRLASRMDNAVERYLDSGSFSFLKKLVNIISFSAVLVIIVGDLSYSLLLLPLTLILKLFSVQTLGIVWGTLRFLGDRKAVRAQFETEGFGYAILALVLHLFCLVYLCIFIYDSVNSARVDRSDFLNVFYLLIFPSVLTSRLNWIPKGTITKWTLLFLSLTLSIATLVISSVFWWIPFVLSLAVIILDALVSKFIIFRKVSHL
ncbi:tetratricopeptide repeat protein [Roseivirga misakiensis]|nr:tetratricopeptide repeat protein [Roseivirga misakiensis]